MSKQLSAVNAYGTDHIKGLRGKLSPQAPLGEVGWFKTGGRAGLLFKPEDRQDLQNFLQQITEPPAIFGALSNTIIRDGGLPGVTIRLGREFAGIEKQEGDLIKSGALALDANVARFSADHGIAGLEFLSGIPGTIGGALRMNAGCYGSEIKDVLVACEVLDPDGQLHILSPADMAMGYRYNDLPEGWIFLNAAFRGRPGSTEKIHEQIKEIKQRRELSQPIREKTGGSTFANPSPADLERSGIDPNTKVWQLIDRVGGRGLMIGGAQMSEKHCNFMINTGTATAYDLEELGETLRRRVFEEFGISLRWEIRRIGLS